MAVNKPVGDNARKGAVRKRSQREMEILGEATWTKQGDHWIAHSTGVLADGRETVGTNVIRHENANVLDWMTRAASVAGQPIDDHALRFRRQSESK